MKTLKQAILEFDESNAEILFNSAEHFNFDLNNEYPDNLYLQDGEDRNREDWDNGDEYIEYKNGIPVFLMYNNNKEQENLKSQLLEKWIVVEFNYSEDSEKSLAVTRRSNFEEINMCDTYADYGNQVGCCNAGCYSLDNSESTAASDCKDAIEEKFNLGFCIDIEECAGEFTVVSLDDEKELTESQVSEIETFIVNWREANENHTKVTGWTYHDSHNFKTVTIASDFGETDATELEEDDQIEILLEMPESTPYISGTDCTEETENYEFHFDRWATNPWYCYVVRK